MKFRCFLKNRKNKKMQKFFFSFFYSSLFFFKNKNIFFEENTKNFELGKFPVKLNKLSPKINATSLFFSFFPLISFSNVFDYSSCFLLFFKINFQTKTLKNLSFFSCFIWTNCLLKNLIY